MNRRSSWAIPYFIFMLIFVVLPLVMIMLDAFKDSNGSFSFSNIATFFQQKEAVNTLIYSIEIAIITTLLCLVIGYPAAYILSRKDLNRSAVTIVLFIMPMWINILVRTLATVALFDFGKIPLGEGALIFGMVYNFLPYMVYPIYNTLNKLDNSYVEAAQDLGANPIQQFVRVIIPLSKPGISSGVLMVFMPTISTFAISELLTMNKVKLFGTTIQENINNGLWNYGSALSLIMLVLIGVTTLLSYSGKGDEQSAGGLL